MPMSIRLVKGIGPATENALNAAGITTAEELATSTVETLVAIPGFSEIRARSVIDHARQCVSDASADEKEDEAENAQTEKSIVEASHKGKAPKQKTEQKPKKKKTKPKKEKKEKKNKAKKDKETKKKTKKDKDTKKKTKKHAAKKKAKKK